MNREALSRGTRRRGPLVPMLITLYIGGISVAGMFENGMALRLGWFAAGIATGALLCLGRTRA